MTVGNKPEDIDLVNDLMHANRQGGTIAHSRRHLYDGERWLSSVKIEGVSGGGTANLFVENTSNDKYLITTASRNEADQSHEVRIIQNVTVDAAGTNLPEINRKSSESNDSANANTEYDITFSGGDVVEVVISPSGQQSAPAAFEGGDLLIAPDDNLVVEVTNTSQNTMNTTIKIGWSEMDVNAIEKY